MKRVLAVAVFAYCVAAAPAFAHSWSPLGWAGPYPGGGTTIYHPENLCKDFTGYVCIVSGTQTFGIPLEEWRIHVSNSGGLSTDYYTDDRDNPGWIVVIGVTGLSWNFTPIPGSYGGIVCQMFTPGQAVGLASQSYGGSRYYYQAVFNGSFGGGLCYEP